MGATSEGGIGVDWEVGTIVWVRRRNGSWWPGRILGQHELSASHLMSPRSGTPVKLLGREDASVDWYNLEKSKRVKAFRCGEFDACIEKAEAARGTPIKKREKYARREDAIIHALELEKQILERKLTKLGGSMPTNYSGTIKKEPAVDFPSEGHVMADDTSASGKLTKCRKVGLPVATKGKSLSAVGGIGDTLFSNQDCSSDGVPRIKFMDGSYTHGNKKGFSPSKNRRPLGGFAEESKRRDKRRPLLQVMQSSAKLQSSPSVACDEYATDQMKVWSSRFGYDSYLQEENAFSGLIERYESQLPENLYLDPDMEQQDALLSSTSQSFARELASLGRNDEYGHKMVHVLEQDGCPNRSVGLVSGRAFENNKGDVGVSRWNLKGKRNIRKLSKRPENLQGGRNIYNDTRGRSIQKDLYSQTGDSDDDDFVERGLQSEFDPIDDVRCQQAFQGSSMDFTDDSMDGSDKDSEGISLPDWDNEKLHHAPRRREWDMGQQFGHVYMGDFHDRMESRLVDVDLKVQASYQGERVPLVSLMSRLNGKAIVGHPLQVEIVSDGLTFTLLSDNDSGGNPSGSLGATTQPVWPTGRRSSMPRIPRPHTASSMEVEGGSGIHHHADLDGRVTSKRPLHFNSDDRIKSKKTSHSRRPAKKSHKKSSKKASLSNLKTRTLSSLAKGQKHATAQSKGGKLSNRTGSLSILMKPGETVPTVAWVPVKVVFSRILEAVGRSPSNPLAHRHLLTGTGSNDGKS